MSKTNKLLFAALFLPILVMVGWMLSLSYTPVSQTIRIKVRGVDPIDLLSGHYIWFEVDYSPIKVCENPRAGESCVCFEEANDGTRLHKPVEHNSCEKLSACKVLLRGTCEGQYPRFNTKLSKYFIPESLASELKVAPPDSNIEINLNAKGEPSLQGFYVKDVKVEDYARAKVR